MRGRRSDRDKVVTLLAGTTGLSNPQVKAQLGLSDDRYETLRSELIENELVEKYVCRGGGIRLTRTGEKNVPSDAAIGSSSVNKEADLYQPLMSYLARQAEEDETQVVVCGTHDLRAHGRWQNPDVTAIAIDAYKFLRRTRVVVTTYEVKQWPRWDVDAVFEAASHRRFAHESYVVLEWDPNVVFSLAEPTHRIDRIARECQRFGIGLQTMQRYYSNFRLHTHIEANSSNPAEDGLETWLEYVFERKPRCKATFLTVMDEVESTFLARGTAVR